MLSPERRDTHRCASHWGRLNQACAPPDSRSCSSRSYALRAIGRFSVVSSGRGGCEPRRRDPRVPPAVTGCAGSV
eukprot:5192218-Lingulodinium_polyedra.AAC.1